MSEITTRDPISVSVSESKSICTRIFLSRDGGQNVENVENVVALPTVGWAFGSDYRDFCIP